MLISMVLILIYVDVGFNLHPMIRMVVREPLPHTLRQQLLVLPCMIQLIFFPSIYMTALVYVWGDCVSVDVCG